MKTCNQPGLGWTTVLRRQPNRIVKGQQHGGSTCVFEIICCDCGDDPALDYSEVPPGLQQLRGPYPIADGIAHMRGTSGGISSQNGATGRGRWPMLADRR